MKLIGQRNSLHLPYSVGFDEVTNQYILADNDTTGNIRYYIISKEEYEKLSNSAPHEEDIFEAAARLRKEFGINDDEFDFDLADFIESVKEPSVYGSSRDRQIEYEMKRLQK